MIVTNGTEKQIIFQLGETLAEIEEQIVTLVLENNHGNIGKTAKALGLQRTALTSRIPVRYPHLRERAAIMRGDLVWGTHELDKPNCPVTPAGACPCNDKTDN